MSFAYVMLCGLAIALVIAGFTDLFERKIKNWLNAAVALGAPIFWIASGMPFWPDIVVQIGLAIGVLAIFATFFAFGWMGGGDVKLLAALALWIEPLWFLNLVLAMSVIGGALTILFGAVHVIRRGKGRPAIPYGLAIASAAIWVLVVHNLPEWTSNGTAFGPLLG